MTDTPTHDETCAKVRYLGTCTCSVRNRAMTDTPTTAAGLTPEELADLHVLYGRASAGQRIDLLEGAGPTPAGQEAVTRALDPVIEWLLHPTRSYTPHELAMEAVRRLREQAKGAER